MEDATFSVATKGSDYLQLTSLVSQLVGLVERLLSSPNQRATLGQETLTRAQMQQLQAEVEDDEEAAEVTEEIGADDQEPLVTPSAASESIPSLVD